jgi:hypothetical protein
MSIVDLKYIRRSCSPKLRRATRAAFDERRTSRLCFCGSTGKVFPYLSRGATFWM